MGCIISSQALLDQGVTSSTPIDGQLYDGQPAYSVFPGNSIDFFCQDDSLTLYYNGSPADSDPYYYLCPTDSFTSEEFDWVQLNLECRSAPPPTSTPPPPAQDSNAVVVPANNHCSNAETLQLENLPVSIQARTSGATLNQNIFGIGVDTNGPTIWYTFEGTGEMVNIRLDCGQTMWGSQVRVFGASSCDDYVGPYHGSAYMCEDGVQITGIATEHEKQYLVVVEGFDGHRLDGTPLPNHGEFDMFIESYL